MKRKRMSGMAWLATHCLLNLSELREKHSEFLCHMLPEAHQGCKPPFWRLCKLFAWYKTSKQLDKFLCDMRLQMLGCNTMSGYLAVYTKTYWDKVSVNEFRRRVLLVMVDDQPLNLHALAIQHYTGVKDESSSIQ